MKSTGEIKRRKLFDEFNLPGESLKDQQIENKSIVPEPGTITVGAGSSPAPSGGAVNGGDGTTISQGTGISSGNMNFSTLSSGYPLGGCGNVGVSSAGLSPGWSDARTWVQQSGSAWNNIQPASQDMFIGATSGLPNNFTLCSSPQSWVSLSAPRPAYCGGCMQFGTVYTTA
jgi:hypothetical protein